MLADYFERTALAAAQVLEGFDLERFRTHLDEAPVGVSLGTRTAEADAIGDLVIRLLARLYPKLALVAVDSDAAALADLARAINPRIDIVEAAATGIVISDGKPFATSIYAGSDGWDAFIDDSAPVATGQSENPFGAGAAACLAAAGLFRVVFLADWEDHVDRGLRLSTFTGAVGEAGRPAPAIPAAIANEAVLVGAGAIGNAALWALRRAPLAGTLHVVDMEELELSNIQRYVLTERADEGAVKVEIASRTTGKLQLHPHQATLVDFLEQNGYTWDALALALDSERDRVAAQASLPHFITNAWTQAGDLGVSSHPTFGDDGACVGCLYLPNGSSKNEDELVAETLGVPQLLMQVRTLLHSGAPVDRALLSAVATAIGQPLEVLLPFEGRTIRELYVEGFCGGAVIPLGKAGVLAHEAQDIHVPLAQQSALAGVLLAAALVRQAIEPRTTTCATRLDVLRSVGAHPTQPVLARRDGRCLCDDPDFVGVWRTKWA